MENKYKQQQQHLQQKSVNSSTTSVSGVVVGGGNNNNNQYLDHVYCHPNASEHNHSNNNNTKSYMRANNNHNNNINLGGVAQAGPVDPAHDVYILIKENKRLKTMLMLHLDLIQEQGDQLLYKDRKVATLTEKVESLRQAKHQLELQVQELQYQLQRQLKRSAGPAKELASVSPPPLAKIQNVVPEVAAVATAAAAPKHIIGECNGKLISKIKLHRVAGGEDDGNANTSAETLTDAETEEGSANKSGELKSDEHSGEEDADEDEVEEVQGEDHEEEQEEDENVADVAEEAVVKDSAETSVEPKELPPAAKPKIATPVQQICVTPPTPSRGKQMPLMLWHAPDINSDESGSGESLADGEPQSQASPATPAEPAPPPSTSNTNEASSKAEPPETSKDTRPPLRRSRRLAYMTTSQLYLTREWEDSEAKSDCEQLHEDVAMQSGASLEIPKWIEHELAPLYCIEGTEDLSDDTFLKRHAKLEVDEKRRKKWDVQQIREQRRIEKLKRRHCKDELQNAQDQQSLSSFYPQPEDISMIYYTSQLPVQAFGEMIPKLSTTTEFTLPWTREPPTTPAANSPQAQGAGGAAEATPQAKPVVQNSSYTFLKKRRRRQSSTQGNAATTARQRSMANQKMASYLETVASK